MVFPSFDLTGRVALVTGAARGLGSAISLALADAGADVALGLRDVNARGDLVDQIGAMRRRAMPLQMDVRRLDQIFQAVDDTVMHLGRLDILVNNAGLAADNLAESVREEDFDLTTAVNLKGTFFCQPGGRACHDPAEERSHHQPEFTGRLRGATNRIDLLHDEGSYCAPHEMPCLRVGEVQHHGKCSSTNAYSHSGDGGCPRKPRVPLRRDRAHWPRCTALGNRWMWQVRSYSLPREQPLL